MTKEIIRIKLTQEYKQKAMKLIDDTIESVLHKHDFNLDNQEKSKIKNFSLDQINVNVSQKNKLKTMWIFDMEENIPVIIEKEKDFDLETQKDFKCYKMQPNLIWTFNNKNLNDGGITQEEFEKEVLKMLLEDFETASFYGTLSYVADNDKKFESDKNE